MIARSMVEGLCQLIWASEEPERAFRWRAFVYLNDWRLQNLRERQGTAPDAKRRDDIEQVLHEHGDIFLTRKAKRAKDSGQPLPQDPYQKHWRADFKLREFCEERSIERLYTEAYEPFSDWHHWGVGGLGAAIRRANGSISYERESLNDSAVSLSAAFQSVLQSIQVVNQCFQLGMEEELVDLRDGFVKYYWTAPQDPD